MRGGATLALGLVGVLAAAGAVRARGSRVIGDLDPALDVDLVRRLDVLAQRYHDAGEWVPHRRDENTRFARNNGIVYLGQGTSRAVFAVPVLGASRGVAIKIGSVRDNRSEARVWREAPAWMRDLLVPVLGVAGDGRWIAMERVKPVTPAAFAKMRDDLVFRRARSPLASCGLLDLGEMNTASDGRVLDYAYLGNEDQWRKCVEPGERARVLEWMAKGSDPKLLKW